jgi:hypothetical protein
MDGLSIKQNVDSAPTVFASDFDICLAGCHGDGSSLLPDGQAASIVPGENVSAGATKKLVLSLFHRIISSSLFPL